MKLTPRHILILSAVGVFIAVVLLVVLLLVPQFRRLGELDRQVQEANDLVARAQSILQVRQAAKDDAAFTDAALLQLAAAVPENPDLPSLIIEMQDVAYESNVQIRSIEPRDLVQAEGYVAMPLEIEVWGGWSDTVDFVQRLARLTRQVRLVQSTSTILDDDEGAVDPLDPYAVESVISVETYVIPASAEADQGTGTTTAPAPGTGQ